MAKGDEYVNKHSLKSLKYSHQQENLGILDPWMWLFETVEKEMFQSVTTQVELKSLVGFSVMFLLSQSHRLVLTHLYQEWRLSYWMIKVNQFEMKSENYA